MEASNNLAAEHPQMIAMALKRSCCQTLPEQMEQERREALDDALADGDIGVLVAPALRPALKVWAQLGERFGGSGGRHNRPRLDYSFLY